MYAGDQPSRLAARKPSTLKQSTGYRELRTPDFDDDEMMVAPVRPVKPVAPPQFTEEQVDECLNNFLADAKAERLECLVEAISTFMVVLAADRQKGKKLPGTLTVKGWIGLLNRWEAMLGQFRSRQVFFAKSFIKEALENSALRLSPMAGAFEELVHLMEDTLQVPVEHVVRKVS